MNAFSTNATEISQPYVRFMWDADGSPDRVIVTACLPPQDDETKGLVAQIPGLI